MNTTETIAEIEAQEEFANPTNYEAMIGKALLGDDKEKNRQMIRVDCKMYASTKMFCACGQCFDQKKIQILRDETETIKSVCCRDCRTKVETKFAGHDLPGWTWANWTTVQPAIPAVTEVKPAKKPRGLKALTAKMVLDLNSYRTTASCKAIYESTGLLVCGVMVIDTGAAGADAAEPGQRDFVRHAQNCILRETSQELNLGEVYEKDGKTYRRMTDETGNVCVINEQYRMTAEKLGHVVRWCFAPEKHVPSVTGIDAAGKSRVCIATIAEN